MACRGRFPKCGCASQFPCRWRPEPRGLGAASWGIGFPEPGSVLSAIGYRSSVPPRRSPFGPRSLRGGRIQVYGCSPGCLLWSIALSVGLTILVNLLIHLF